ncbi:hypothetical protein DWU98_03850 [Dyella monticola]|uniref:Uncharacterized protein n=2 Tax=Dyella monticola TaxID=1927958 RepID=A0A370X9H8_9GAMM|nr:hypothetical protein DWU98_03850 [Dyella monticola]
MAHAQDRFSMLRPVAGFGVPVSKDKLDAVRGGFDLGNGLQVSFGIQRAVYVDGNLVAYVNVTIPDLAHITAQQATSLAEALGTVDVQVGKGNTYAPSSVTSFVNSTVQSAVSGAINGASSAGVMSPSTQANAASVAQNALTSPIVSSTITPASASQASAATVIQNTVNNQVISSLTTLNVAISALNAMRSQALQQSLQNAQQLQALSH